MLPLAHLGSVPRCEQVAVCQHRLRFAAIDAHHVTIIEEEYGVQRYEGALTLFGPRESPVRFIVASRNITDRVARLQIPSTPTSTSILVLCVIPGGQTWQ